MRVRAKPLLTPVSNESAGGLCQDVVSVKFVQYVLIVARSVQEGYPSGGPQGVGAFAYQDSAGHRYGGTYGLKDGQVFNTQGDDYVPFGNFGGFQDSNDFFPQFFRNFQNLLQEAFRDQSEQQQKALDTARKAYEITSNGAGFFPFDFRSPSAFADFPGFTNFAEPSYDMSGFGPNSNSAFSSAIAGPGFNHQIAAISPGNPQMPNVDVMNFAEMVPQRGGNFKSVSSSSSVSSSNINGKKETHKQAQTVVNDNGKITAYKVHS